ncbi:MAG: ABC transporter [Firmicutes bacterium HGW-Firmicutes-1]|jgi:ABC-2 type transport system ATP-binding protein|nr:MAG: ABC transporter [Firmicutes bacterium HGW-Firmicutes-1]
MSQNKETAIRIDDLSMSFGSKEVLKRISLEVFKGEIIGYIGPNGAGKSTTIKIILGLVDGYIGNVQVLGRNIADGDIEYKKTIGYVPEVADIYDNLTAREYLGFIGALYGLTSEVVDTKSTQLMRLLGIEEVIDARIASYSKGMKQKVLLISSLLHNPDILFLDEPLSGLDANSVIVVKEILTRLAKAGKTIFYSSHIMDVVEKISNRIILIHEGEIVADGSFEELKEKCMEGSLEEIFNQLTGFDQHIEMANEFVAIMKGQINEGI